MEFEWKEERNNSSLNIDVSPCSTSRTAFSFLLVLLAIRNLEKAQGEERNQPVEVLIDVL